MLYGLLLCYVHKLKKIRELTRRGNQLTVDCIKSGLTLKEYLNCILNLWSILQQSYRVVVQ